MIGNACTSGVRIIRKVHGTRRFYLAAIHGLIFMVIIANRCIRIGA